MVKLLEDSERLSVDLRTNSCRSRERVATHANHSVESNTLRDRFGLTETIPGAESFALVFSSNFWMLGAMKPFLTLLGVGVCLLGASVSVRGHDVAKEMATAATKLLEALNADQKGKATFEWKDEERFNWHYIPKDRKGLPVKEMTPEQRRLAHGLLLSGSRITCTTK